MDHPGDKPTLVGHGHGHVGNGAAANLVGGRLDAALSGCAGRSALAVSCSPLEDVVDRLPENGPEHTDAPASPRSSGTEPSGALTGAARRS